VPRGLTQLPVVPRLAASLGIGELPDHLVSNFVQAVTQAARRRLGDELLESTDPKVERDVLARGIAFIDVQIQIDRSVTKRLQSLIELGPVGDQIDDLVGLEMTVNA
jgi:hypothetical protein